MMRTFSLRIAGSWVVAVLLALVAGTAAAQQGNQNCIDDAVISCFDTCNDIFYQECALGCSAGGAIDPQKCTSQCTDPVCESKCLQAVALIQSCSAVTTKIDIVRGAITLNRASGIWQQAVRLTNNTALETVGNVVLVVDALQPGWTLANGDGTTRALGAGGSPYRNAADSLGPGASVTVVLTFSRTGTLPFGYSPMVYASRFR